MKNKILTKKNSVAFFIFSWFLSFPVSAFAVDWCLGGGTGGINIGIGTNACNGGSGGWASIVSSNPFGLPEGSLYGILANTTYWLLAVFAILGVVGFVLSGIFYLLSGANEDLAKKGKSGMSNSVIGIIVGLSGIVIIRAAMAFLSGASKTF